MSRASQDDARSGPANVGRGRGTLAALTSPVVEKPSQMSTFVEGCVQTVAGSAVAAQRRARGRPHARKLLRLLADKTNILITAHEHPDPDAIGAAFGLAQLLAAKLLPDAKITVSFKGRMGGGINDVFFKECSLTPHPWDEAKLATYDATILIDAQPLFAYSPFPAGFTPTAVIDHHRPGRGRRPKCAFCDIRTDVGATTSIIFSYFMELEAAIDPSLAATMLYAIESDLAGAAGQPGDLDNIALSNLTLKADTRKLYRMRYAPLPRSHYVAFAAGLNRATVYDNVVFTHVGEIDTPEKPAVVADFLLRLEQVQWVLVLGIYEGKLVLSLRTNNTIIAAGDLIGRLLRGVGEGGGHRTKAGGIVRFKTAAPTPAEVDRVRTLIRRRFLKVLGVQQARGQKLVPTA